MFRGYRVVVCSPTRSRRKHLEILSKYMFRDHDRGLIDKWELWMHADAEDDLGAAKELAAKDRRFIDLVVTADRRPAWTQPFYLRCTDPDTIYIKADDDLVYIAQDAVENILTCRLEHSRPFVVFGNIVNNILCGHIHQRIGALDLKFGKIAYTFDDPIGLHNFEFVCALHRRFIALAEMGRTRRFKFGLWPLTDYEKFSINFFAFHGAEWAIFNGDIQECDEPWITFLGNKERSRPNLICGNALVVHYAFGPQREHLNKFTNLLDRYLEIACKECA